MNEPDVTEKLASVNASTPASGSADSHAVRWARRKVGVEMDWTKWHATHDSCLTLCGLPIVLAVASFTPDTDEIERTDCAKCLRKLNPPNKRWTNSRRAKWPNS